MAWEELAQDGFQGMASFFGQVLPILLPLLLVVFLGVLLIVIAKRVGIAVS